MLPASFRQNISSFTNPSIRLLLTAARAKSTFAGKGYGFSITALNANILFKSKILCFAEQYLCHIEYYTISEFSTTFSEIDASYRHPAGYAL
jgi:hypothetical protein|tara:strand:+ start:280 stop:555 length:276 start_codon:yes stop_codon:yes gene_type:complete